MMYVFTFLGEFGYVDYIRCGETDGHVWWNGCITDDNLDEYCANNSLSAGDTAGVTLYHPEDVIDYTTMGFGTHAIPAQYWGFVGVDEYSSITGLSEAEIITSPIIGTDGQPLQTPGFAYTPLHSILAPLNYGKVNMQGIDIGLSYLMPEYNLIFSGISFFNMPYIFLLYKYLGNRINQLNYLFIFNKFWRSRRDSNPELRFRRPS